MDEFTRQYIVTALWSSNDESDDRGGEPLAANYSADDIHPDTLAAMIADCTRFQAIARKYLVHYDLGTAGHDFWHTRNGHGCGFWDGDYREPEATYLTDECRSFGEVELYVGDDGMIHMGGCVMGYSYDRSYRVYKKYHSRILDLWNTARSFGMTHEAILIHHERLFEATDYKGLPSYRKLMLQEVCRMKLDECSRHYLTWTHVIDGVRVPSRDPRLEGRYGELNTDESHHMWSHDLSKPF